MTKSSFEKDNLLNNLHFNLTDEKPLEIIHDRYEDAGVSSFDMHYELEIGIVFSGKMIRKYQSWDMEVSEGQVWLCSIWEPHGFCLCEVPCEVFTFVVNPIFLLDMEQLGFNWFELFTQPPQSRSQIMLQESQEILKICQKLRSIIEYKKTTDMLWSKILLLQILSFLAENTQGLVPMKKASAVAQYTFIQTGIQLVFRSKKLIPVEDAAKACSMSPSNFSKYFKKLMGITFARFALRHRIKEAARQLIYTDDSIKSIALEWGFIDSSHFHNCFVNHFSISPKEYRKLFIKNNKLPV